MAWGRWIGNPGRSSSAARGLRSPAELRGRSGGRLAARAGAPEGTGRAGADIRPSGADRVRILLAIESSGPGGAEQVVLRLADALRAAGDEPLIATMRPGWITQQAERAGHPVWVLPQRPGLDLLWILRFARRLRQAKVDVLHAHEFAMAAFGGAAALLARMPVAATVHGKSWVADRARRRFAYRALHRLGMPVVAVSRDLAGFLSERLRLPPREIAVLPNGIPIPDLPADRLEARRAARAALHLPAEGPLAVCVGNLYPVKDHATLLRALPRLANLRVAIAGRGAEETRLRSLSAELGVSDRVTLLGVRSDVNTVLAAGDLFVQPSRSEGLPLSILEAMAAGLPIVATRVGGVPEAVTDGETGLLVPPGDPGTLSEALAALLRDPPSSRALASAARRRAEREYSVQAMCERYRRLYDRIAR